MQQPDLHPSPRHRHLRQTLGCVAVICALVVSISAGAADVPARNTPPESRAMRESRALIAQKQWVAAEKTLTAYVAQEPQDADAFNLLGYTLRHLDRLPEALTAYKEALRLNPGHLGAHEYIGEAYIRLGDLVRAGQHLDALVRLCPQTCSERDDLQASLKAAASRDLRPVDVPIKSGNPG